MLLLLPVFNNSRFPLTHFHAGKGVNVEGAVPSEQEVNQPKPAKRARTSFTADQLQVGCCASPLTS